MPQQGNNGLMIGLMGSNFVFGKYKMYILDSYNIC